MLGDTLNGELFVWEGEGKDRRKSQRQSVVVVIVVKVGGRDKHLSQEM